MTLIVPQRLLLKMDFSLFIFVLSNKYYKFHNKYMWKNVHLVIGTGIRTHDLQNMSLLSQPLDQGYCLKQRLFLRFLGTFTHRDAVNVFANALLIN